MQNTNVPKGWDIKSMGDCFRFLRTKSFSRAETGCSGDVKYVHYGDIHTKYPLIISPDKIDLFVSTEQAVNADLLRSGDLVLLDASEDYEGTTKCIELSNLSPDDKIISGLHTIALRDNNGVFANRFRAYITSMPYVKKNFWKQISGVKVYGISKDNLKKIKVLVPPIEEQKKIAEILGTWDRAIEELTELITEKKELKRGLMQQLLTGTQRLPGFTKPWVEKKLGDLFNIKKGSGLSKDMVDIYAITPCILYGELYTKYSEVIGDVVSKTDVVDGVKSAYGDILIPASTTTTGIDLANASVLQQDDVLLGGDINILRKKRELCSEFFAYALTHAYKFRLARLAQGITIVHLYGEFLKSVKINVPEDIKEQQTIANMLMKADAEIDLLNQQLDVLKEQKRGLMQKLLTGEIRVKVDTETC